MDKEALKDFILKNSSDSRFYGLFYREKKMLEENDLMGFAQHQLKKNKKIFIGSILFLPLLLLQIVFQFTEFIETESIFALVVSLVGLAFCFGGLFFSTREYYTIKSSMTLLISVLEDEQKTQETASDSSAILSKA